MAGSFPRNRTYIVGSVLVIIAVITSSCYFRRHTSNRDSRIAQTINGLILHLNLPYKQGRRTFLQEQLTEFSATSDRGVTNRGAEMIMRLVQKSDVYTGDNDGDGVIEALDRNANPLIVLGPGIERDELIMSDGSRVRVSLPPYAKDDGYYVTTYDGYFWYLGDAHQDLLEQALWTQNRPEITASMPTQTTHSSD